MTSSYLEILFWKWYTGDYTEAERAELIALAQEPSNQEILQKLFEKVWEQPTEGEVFSEASAMDIFNAIIQAGKERPAAIIRPNLWKRRTAYIAAASIILISLGTILFFVHTRLATPKNMPSISKMQDIAPGGNKAILTLADGSTLALDSPNIRTLPQQGASTVVQSKPGQLVYASTIGSSPSVVLYNTLITPRAGQFRLVLPDGTRVWLNAASSLRYPVSFAGLKQREVRLTGEAYFEVAKDPTRPFNVAIGSPAAEGGIVQVLGTNFNINAYTDEPSVNTTLLEGSVRISKGKVSRLLRPGEQAQALQEGEIRVIAHVDTEKSVAWKDGLFRFKGDDIPTIMRQVARWYDVEVTYQYGLPRRTFSGTIPRNENVSKVLKILEAVGFHFTVDGKKIRVLQ